MALGPGRATNEPANYFAFAVQSAVNVEGTSFYFTKHLSGSGFDVTSEFKAERIGGAGREVGLIYKTMVKADGSLVTYGWPDGTGRLLAIALGKDEVTTLVATSSAENELVLHKIASGQATLPYFTADQTWADESERTTNCQVSELKIEGTEGAPIKFTAPFISGGSPVVRAAALTPTRESGTPFMYPNASAALQVFSGAAGAAGKATSSELEKFALTIKNTLDEGIQTLALNRTDVVWETVDFNLDGTLKYTDRNIWNQVNYFGASQVSIQLATGSFDFFAAQSSSASQSLHLSVPILVFGSVKVNRLDPDGKTMLLDFTALTQGGPTSAVIAEVVTRATGLYTNSAT
jgi:hypothetical protein